MKLAYISYELPPDTALGGIGTYTFQVSNAMVKRGHDVHVFCGSTYRTISEKINGVWVHRIHCDKPGDFKERVIDVFEKIYNDIKFDIVESPEFGADGIYLKQHFPEIILVVKLHCPLTLIYDLEFKIYNKYSKINLKSLRKKISYIIRKYILKKYYFRIFPNEYKLVCLADEIHAPSKSILEFAEKKWKIKANKLFIVPNIFTPNKELLEIKPVAINADLKNILFLGRLEPFKGILIFIKLIPLLKQKYPGLQFHFVGKVKTLGTGERIDDLLKRKLKKYEDSLHFSEAKHDEVSKYFKNADVCIFPSKYESFGYACLEAMSASRCVIASKNGGMGEIINNLETGILIDPDNLEEIVNAFTYIAENPKEMNRIGSNARKHVLDNYNANTIGTMIEELFTDLLIRKDRK